MLVQGDAFENVVGKTAVIFIIIIVFSELANSQYGTCSMDISLAFDTVRREFYYWSNKALGDQIHRYRHSRW